MKDYVQSKYYKDGFLVTNKEGKKSKEWKEMSPEPLFRRLEQAQKIVANSSFEGLGIDRNAKPSEGGPIKDAAYTYGPHLDFLELIFTLLILEFSLATNNAFSQ